MDWLKYKIIIILVLLLTSCSVSGTNELPPNLNNTEYIVETPVKPTPTPYLPQIEPPIEESRLLLYVPGDLNFALISLSQNKNLNLVDASDGADCELKSTSKEQQSGEYILSLVAPFNTITDGLSLKDLELFFQGIPFNENPNLRILISQNDLNLLDDEFKIDVSLFIIVKPAEMLDIAYKNPNYWVITPFERLVPAWKVLQIENISPFDQDFKSEDYALTIPMGISCSSQETQLRMNQEEFPFITNRDPAKFTSVLLTGTTALTRATGARMELYGNSYPGEAVKQWFMDADITHISNEVSFSALCPHADPNQKDLFFCSRPEYADLFDYLEIDVVELTGNHLVDKGTQPLNDTFKLLKEKSIPFYAAGTTIDEAESPVKFDINGNKIAFLGCNEAGPNFVWIAEGRSGVLRCDFDRLAETIRELRGEGFLPIVTYQYWETAQFKPMPYQRDDSIQMIDAGAIIVSGSQSHLPMSMEVYKQGFIHYGLGNLFFDQMDIPFPGTRREFLDRHIFYDGKYLGVQIFTAMLEDYAQPRPMTSSERKTLLKDAFSDFRIVMDQ